MNRPPRPRVYYLLYVDVTVRIRVRTWENTPDGWHRRVDTTEPRRQRGYLPAQPGVATPRLVGPMVQRPANPNLLPAFLRRAYSTRHLQQALTAAEHILQYLFENEAVYVDALVILHGIPGTGNANVRVIRLTDRDGHYLEGQYDTLFRRGFPVYPTTPGPAPSA